VHSSPAGVESTLAFPVRRIPHLLEVRMPRFHSLVVLAALAFLLAPRLAPAADVSAKSPAGDRIATASDKAICVTDLQSQRLLMKMQAHKCAVTALVYSPDGKSLASADKEGGVVLFDAATGKMLWKAEALPGVNVLQMSKDGRKVEAKAPGGTRVFNLATGKEIK
jgi:WD40 repeat protein